MFASWGRCVKFRKKSQIIISFTLPLKTIFFNEGKSKRILNASLITVSREVINKYGRSYGAAKK